MTALPLEYLPVISPPYPRASKRSYFGGALFIGLNETWL